MNDTAEKKNRLISFHTTAGYETVKGNDKSNFSNLICHSYVFILAVSKNTTDSHPNLVK